MTRTSEQAELDRAQYRNDNPNPRQRPGVDQLISKLRGLSSLQDPAAVEIVVDDLIHHNFIFKAPHPNNLWNILIRVHSYWLESLGFPARSDERMQISAASGTELFEPARAELPENRSLLLGHEFVKAPYTGVSYCFEPSDTLRDGGICGQMESAHYPPVEKDVAGGFIDLEDKKLKREVRNIIVDHYYALNASLAPLCACGKRFDFIEEWANHVRSVIWRALSG